MNDIVGIVEFGEGLVRGFLDGSVGPALVHAGKTGFSKGLEKAGEASMAARVGPKVIAEFENRLGPGGYPQAKRFIPEVVGKTAFGGFVKSVASIATGAKLAYDAGL